MPLAFICLILAGSMLAFRPLWTPRSFALAIPSIDHQRSLLDANDASSRRRQVVAAPTCRPSRASGSRPWMIRRNSLVGAPDRRFP